VKLRSIVPMRLVVLVLLAGASVVAAPRVAPSTDIAVNTTADENNSDGDCSLREAIRAANLNAARDACPAGSNTATDHVILQNGATYTLTVSGTDNAALLGDLDVVNNTAATDLLLDVAGGGTATIVQASDPADRIVDVRAGAGFVVEGVTFSGGSAPAGESGGAITIGASADGGLGPALVGVRTLAIDGGAIAQDPDAALPHLAAEARAARAEGAYCVILGGAGLVGLARRLPPVGCPVLDCLECLIEAALATA